MKTIITLFISLILLTSCDKRNLEKKLPQEELEHKHHVEIHREMDKISAELGKFEEQLKIMYTDSEKNPEKVIKEADSLLTVKYFDKYKLQIKPNIDDKLHYLKAELFYKLGEFSKSIKELNTDQYKQGDAAAAYAANYIKLKDYKRARLFIDSIGNYISDYARGNYYESMGNKIAALKIYHSIRKNKSIKHYEFYKLTIARLNELNKNNPKLLNEIYFPTGNPAFKICDSDNKNRRKIFNLMEKLPENQKWAGTSIIESPQENDKNYYWVRVKTVQDKEFNYYIYEKTFEIKFFDQKNNKLMTLAEWRMSK
ncbi:hypothetical protein SGQ44_15915 [Flavobacterium sp. Fl-77]|uniref:Lipoprotein n=1 Tax=Flavobacterium flavipigmentatum TaxID=2893884 RepID=A0AAJ2SBI1_9FLAO|nr:MULTISPECIES: hypothetical protein [unclassified Flavobacterium]MDX6183788.1 hypothetical protein [Flavobacterium sp. Fl-33]MDX6187251.1 hypothetical protein [Flavobacterium sp. Fl-77]UFH38066.1 hypothetical protein LNP22_15160 [Flavobacterium sp. F-70]